MASKEQINLSENIKSRLSLLWIFVMFNMAFADILSFINPGGLKQIMTGYADGILITPEFVLMAAIMLEIPIAMIVLSRVLKYKVNRWANIVAGIITIAYVIIGGSSHLFYLFIAAMEVGAMLLIIWYAWKWPKPAIST